ncbi:hypothetical protein Tco_1266735 [Tanacetum coccineum]
MPTNLRIYDGSTDPDDHISHFVRVANQGEWEMSVWCRMFQQPLDRRQEDGSTECLMSVLIAGRTFERGLWKGCPRSDANISFMSNSKCPELARRFADQVPQTVIEMMKWVDDFVKSEEAFKSIELPRREQSKRDRGRHTRDSVPYDFSSDTICNTPKNRTAAE